MSEKKADFSRRDFLKTAGTVGIGSILSPIDNLSHAKGLYASNETKQTFVPTRPFGKTGVNVPILGLGGAFNRSNQLLLRQAVKMGVTYWDTAESYGYGKSEEAIGKYFEKYPEDRKKIFLVTKCGRTTTRAALAMSLENSLERLKTSYIDLYFIHGLSTILWINDEIKAWAEEAKAKGKIRFFGFSTHKNMEECMLGAAKLGWIDGIMPSYNYRLMHTDSMKSAIDACVKAGIGLTAMKTQAKPYYGIGEVGEKTDTAEKLTERFMEKEYTLEQARLKAVWENPNIASICSHMKNMTVLQANIAAALSKTKLSFKDRQLLEQYARETAPHYCAGCACNCETTIDNEVPISDVMRYLMYSRGYGEPERAKTAFNGLPSRVRKRMANIDYRKAELKCPQGMQIGRLMHEAVIELA
jgi:predicted aldo/keto reductase-like oxidoreductase